MRREKNIYQIRKFNLHGIQHISFLYFFAPKMPLSFVFQVGGNANLQVIKSNIFQFIKNFYLFPNVKRICIKCNHTIQKIRFKMLCEDKTQQINEVLFPMVSFKINYVCKYRLWNVQVNNTLATRLLNGSHETLNGAYEF